MAQKLSLFTTLESIRINTPGRHGFVDAEVLPDLLLNDNSLAPLLKLRGIKEFLLAVHIVALTPRALLQIAAAWPNLENLKLGPGVTRGGAAPVNVEDLLLFTTACPHLKTLAVLLSTDVRPASLACRPRSSQSTSSLETLFIGMPRIAHPGHLAVFLSSTFPRARQAHLPRGHTVGHGRMAGSVLWHVAAVRE